MMLPEFEPTPQVESPSEATSLEPLIEEAQETKLSVENLTLAQVVDRFFRDPGATLRMVVEVTQAPAMPIQAAGEIVHPSIAITELLEESPAVVERPEPAAIAAREDISRRREAIMLGLRLWAVLVTLLGSIILASRRTEAEGLVVGLPYLIVGFAVWIGSEVYRDWPSLSAWWQGRREQRDTSEVKVKMPYGETSLLRFGVFAAAGAICTYQTWDYTSDNKFTDAAFYFWIVSIFCWVAAFAPSDWGISSIIVSIRDRVRGVRIRGNRTLLALVAIILLGGFFRFANLYGVPPEMTSDHVEKLLDSQRVLEGTHQIFFPNNGGREPFQMYAMALVSRLPGLGMDFFTLKFLSVLEGLITIPILWWMGREIIGEDESVLGNIVGLVLAGLVAASYWHTALSRLALRIVLTPLVAGLLIIFLSRALRYNRRGDFIKAGLVLGFGLYAYQAVRMLPIVVVVGVVLALLFKARSLQTASRYLFNLAVLVVIVLVIFVPLLHFWVQYPDDFWRRTSGRLLGDALIQTTNERGELVEREPTPEERTAAFQQNMSTLFQNIRNALLMYNWKGDVAWINGAPNRPAMDMLTGTLLIVGLAAWLGRMFRRRDPADWLIPAMLFIMLLPSALSIAYPMENPSATRTSGSLPEAYLLAALPLALIMRALMRLKSGAVGMGLATGLASVVIVGAFTFNAGLYFTEFADSYRTSSLPYREAGQRVRGFAESDGSYGNAFMIGYPYWWDHRAIGLAAGLVDWPNGIVSSDDIPRFLNEASQRAPSDYPLDPDKDILFFYATPDVETQRRLQEWFPTGYWQEIQSYQPEDQYIMFRVPRLGREGFVRFIEQTLTGEG
jgi:hypothetical protein